MASKEEKARRKQIKDDHLRAEQASRAAHMPIDRSQLEALLDHVDAAVQARLRDASTADAVLRS